MNLDRHQEVARIWDWLPAFRAAAEYQSLQRAAIALAVSPSALSRSIKLLEEALGISVFNRSPAGLTLTPQGDQLLAATREAMRGIHGAMPTTTAARLRAGAVGPALPRLLCDAAMDTLPQWPLALSEVTHHDAGDQLRRGDLDVALMHAAPDGPGLASLALPPLQMVLAGAPGCATAQVTCVATEDFRWPSAHVTAPNLERLVEIAARLEIAAFLPRCFLPQQWVVLESRPALSVSFVTRDYSNRLPPFLLALHECLARRLQLDGLAADSQAPSRTR